MDRRAARVGHDIAGRVLRSGICLGVIACASLATPVAAESLPEALAKAYQTNPQLNADRARQQVRHKEEQLNQAPKDTFERDNKGTSMRNISKSYEHIPIPK